jgi:hypothetical protein
MKVQVVFVLLSIFLLLASCNGKFDYRHRYEGEFAIQDSVVVPNFPSSNARHYKGSVFQGDEGELVFELADGVARVLTVDKQGILGDDLPYAITGSYSDNDHFSFVALILDPGSNYTYRIYTTGTRIHP